MTFCSFVGESNGIFSEHIKMSNECRNKFQYFPFRDNHVGEHNFLLTDDSVAYFIAILFSLCAFLPAIEFAINNWYLSFHFHIEIVEAKAKNFVGCPWIDKKNIFLLLHTFVYHRQTTKTLHCQPNIRSYSKLATYL